MIEKTKSDLLAKYDEIKSNFGIKAQLSKRIDLLQRRNILVICCSMLRVQTAELYGVLIQLLTPFLRISPGQLAYLPHLSRSTQAEYHCLKYYQYHGQSNFNFQENHTKKRYAQDLM